MKVYAGMDPRLPLRDTGDYARRVEAMGYDGLQISETIHDSLTVAALAVEHTGRLSIRTAVTLAFPRSPTLTAYAAWDLAVFSGGRFELGLGTQIKANLEDRYGLAWTEPVGRLRDYVGAMSAAFASFATGEGITFDSPSYHLRRMQPYFNPGPDAATTPPRLFIGGVNAGLCQLAGELAAGFLTHPTSSNPRYLTDVALPNLRTGADRAGRDVAEVEVVLSAPLITGSTCADLDHAREHQRRSLAFLFSTPAYRRTLELYGWADLDGALRAMIRAERWSELPTLVTDEVLDTLVPCATYADLPGVLAARYTGLADAIVVTPPPDPAHDEELARAVHAIRTEWPLG